ncbi:helix-turn-helix transcriptional regulator [Lacibacterium aquatile]|uniref:Helix-turn-helix transcriptional regulator n=1 Tax=Lacibacterium aquatile TaxID=1168082 RepID=A0ABW5E0B0_9PROT
MSDGQPIAGKSVYSENIASLAEQNGADFKVLEPSRLSPDAAVLKGDYRMIALRGGLSLHSTDAEDLHDLTTQSVSEAGLMTSLFLRGSVDMQLGDRSYHLGPGVPQAGDLQAFVLASTGPDRFVRHAKRGNQVRKVNVTVTQEWLENGGVDLVRDFRGVLRFAADNMASAFWRPSPRLLSLVEQILNPPNSATFMTNLYLESRAVEVVAETLAAMAGEDMSQAGGLSTRDRERVRGVRDYLEANLGEALSLEEIARVAGMSISVMQRLFRSAYGTSVFDYVRRRSIERARDALLQDRVTVTEAAFIAGYNSPANFATAFKRQFGVSPKDVRLLV